MIVVYRIFLAIAAVLVIAIGGSWLADKYGVGPDLGWWNTPGWLEAYNARVVPATDPGDVSIPIGALGPRRSWEIEDRTPLLLPVFYGLSFARPFGYSISHASEQGAEQVMGAGTCSEATVNLLMIDVHAPDGTPVFDHQVFLPSWLYFSSNSGQSIVALVVDKDTNKNGTLDCGDEAKFESISLTDNSTNIASRSFSPDHISRIEYDTQTQSFSLTEAVPSGDKLLVKTITIARKDLSVTEVTAPDVLTKAKAAFARTGDR